MPDKPKRKYRRSITGKTAAGFAELETSKKELQCLNEELNAVNQQLQEKVAELERATEALRESEEKFRSAFAHAAIGFAMTDPDGRFLDANPAYCMLTGYSIDELRTMEFPKLIHPDDSEQNMKLIRRMLAGEIPDFTIENRYIRKGGENVWIHKSVSLVRDTEGKPNWIIALVQDVTKRKQAEQEIRKLNETLEQRVADRTAEVRQQADQLRALANQLSRAELRERKRLANILHDHIQQLIVAARMQINWSKRDNNAERMQATPQNVDDILREALEASRSLTVDLSPPALQETGLTGGLSWLAVRILEKNRFTVNLRADNKAEPAGEETRFLLFECVRELLFNAIKHAEVSEAQVTLLRTSDAQIKLIVSDQGKGFDPDIIRKRHSEEMTFGLFSIQERLAHIGGRMDVESAPGKGTRVTILVPAGEAAARLERSDEEPLKGPASIVESRIRSMRELCRVLIVDDHKIMREGLTGLLQFESGIEVVGEAADGPQAIELVRMLKPDVVIMDVNIGDMTGVETTRRIVADCPSIKVIGLSMHLDTHVAIAMREAGATAYLTKGGPSEDLIAAIRACAPNRSSVLH